MTHEPNSGQPSARHPEDFGVAIVRVTISTLMAIHGVTRVSIGGVSGFGEALDAMGFPYGLAIAWSITLFELVATPLLAARLFVVPICIGFSLQLIAGIVLVHYQEGWFVVGAGRNGMEYSVLLILSFIAVAVGNGKKSST